ncbi:MAG TPA: AAA family ATPase [Planctomycetia bacterium]|nr:AAA family ATPase [Planctomycetia bacterium]
MASLLRVAIVDSVNETREAIQKEIAACSEIAWLEADCQRYDVFLDVVAQHHPDVAIVCVDGDETLALSLIQQLTTGGSELNVVAVSSKSDARFAAELIRMGVRDFVPYPPRPGELANVFSRIAPSQSRSDSAVGRSPLFPRRVIAFAGTDGGIGSTTLAVNVGCILAQDPNYSVALLDLDLFLGDSHVCLDLAPRTNLTQLLENIDTLDASFVKRAVAKHESGLNLIPHPDRIHDLSLVTPSAIERLILLLKRSYTHILIDLSKAYSPVDMAAMGVADDVLVAMQLDMSSLYNVIRLNDSLSENHALLDKTKLVANRTGSDFGITIERAEETIGRRISFQIPNDARTVSFARDNGKPLYGHARGTKVFQAMLQMTNTLVGRERPQSATTIASNSNIFGRLFGKK